MISSKMQLALNIFLNSPDRVIAPIFLAEVGWHKRSIQKQKSSNDANTAFPKVFQF